MRLILRSIGSLCLNAAYECLLQNAPADGFEDETEQVSFEVFTLAHVCGSLRQIAGRSSVAFDPVL